jgi:hypothetical protein
MKFVLEVPDREVYEAAEEPEYLALEIAELITNEIFDFSSVSVVPQRGHESDSERLLAS